MKTRPEDIKGPTYKAIWERLKELDYPCTVVAYGAERTTRTTYRGEHGSEFAIAFCHTPDEAWAVVDNGWPGYPPDLCVYAIPGDIIRIGH